MQYNRHLLDVLEGAGLVTVLGATTMPRFLRCRDWQIILCTTGGMQAPQHRRPVGRGFGTDYRVEQESAKHPPKFTGRILPHREEKVKWAYPGLPGRHLLDTPGWQRAPRNTQRVVLLVGSSGPTRADCQSALQKRIPSCGHLAAPGSAPLSLAVDRGDLQVAPTAPSALRVSSE